MSDDEDELPPVSVVYRASSQSFKMPTADVIASERAREQECQRELRLLHQDLSDEDVTSTVDTTGIEESEASLAAAVCALKVRPSKPAASPPPTAATLLAAMRDPLADTFLVSYLQALQRAQSVEALAERTLSAIEAALCGGREWAAAEVVGCGVWLCAAVAWEGPRVRLPAAARALHRLLEVRASFERVEALSRCVCAARCYGVDAVAEWAWRARVCDALRSGGEASRRVASALRRRALLDLLGAEAADVWAAAADGWRHADARTRRALVQVLGRELADCEPTRPIDSAAVETALATLARRAPSARRLDLELFNVQVTASMLRTQFRANN